MKKIYSFLLAASIVVASSCKKDIGNYEYHDINKVTISTIGETGTISAVFGKPLTIKPEVSYSMDTKDDPSRYSYEWSYIEPVAGSNKIIVLATTKDLELPGLPLKVANDPYKFYYRITDKETGVQFDKEFKLTVRNEINEGWLLMTDVNGNAQLDMLSLDLNNTTFTTINDLLAKTGSVLKLKGKPSLVYSYDMGTYAAPGINLPYGFYVGTNQETNRIDPENFRWSSNYNVQNEVFGYSFPENFHYDVIKKCGIQHSYMIANGDLFNFDKTYGVRYSTPLNYLNGKIFKIAPFMALEEINGLYPCVVFDVENKRFIKHSNSTIATAGVFTDPTGTNKKFSYNIGMDLVWMDFVNGATKEVAAILKDGSNKYWLAKFAPSSGVQNYYDQMIGTDFDKAEQIAISSETGYIFYNVGGKVYEYDMFSKTTKLMLDMGAQKVSVLKFQVFHKTSKYKDTNKLIVCSYDPALPADKNGKMEMFTVPGAHGDLVSYKSYSGFGKVVSLHYRER